MTIERQSEKTTGMYKLEYKEKISAEADKLSAALQKVGSAAYSSAEAPKEDDTASPDGSAAEPPKDDKEENKEEDKKES